MNKIIIKIGGTAGAGKTTLALEIAKILTGRVSFEIKDPDLMDQGIASTLSHMKIQEQRLNALERKEGLHVVIETVGLYRNGEWPDRVRKEEE